MTKPCQTLHPRGLATATALHFLVDGLCLCCLYLLTGCFGTERLLHIFLTYNLLAFATQPLTGFCIDRMRQRHWMLLAAAVLLTLAVLTAAFTAEGILPTEAATLTVATLLGMGNSLFHVWGGKQTALTSGNDLRALGVFVSTGAFGLAFSAVFCSWVLLYVFLLTICVLSVTYLHFDVLPTASEERNSPTPPSSFGRKGVWMVAILLALMAFVGFRSWMGESLAADLVRTHPVVLAIGLTSMLGKMAGGWMARRWGTVKTLLTVLAIALVALMGKGTGMATVLTGLFAINCTMPVTLFWANATLKGHEGLAFGLLAAALMPGYLLATI